MGYTSDDMVVMQALVAAGLGVTTLPGLALRAHRAEGIVASELPGSQRHVYAATYGEPPDPPATAALLAPSPRPPRRRRYDARAHARPTERSCPVGSSATLVPCER
jgi:DNA-binding transcriptional LysR family regulator